MCPFGTVATPLTSFRPDAVKKSPVLIRADGQKGRGAGGGGGLSETQHTHNPS